MEALDVDVSVLQVVCAIAKANLTWTDTVKLLNVSRHVVLKWLHENESRICSVVNPDIRWLACERDANLTSITMILDHTTTPAPQEARTQLHNIISTPVKFVVVHGSPQALKIFQVQSASEKKSSAGCRFDKRILVYFSRNLCSN